jgi:hypothetical protein
MTKRWSKLVLSLALAIAGCAKSRGTGDGITETGNPPVLEPDDIALVVTRDAVHIVGSPGAVTPGGSQIEIENLATGDAQRVIAAADGSFDVQVEGSIDDTYTVHALDADTDEPSVPVYVSRGGAIVGTDGGALTCEQRAEAIRAEFEELAKDADRSCNSNADCTQLRADVSCPAWICGGPIVSRTVEAALDAPIASIVEDSCVSFQADNCFEGMPVPSCISSGPIACVDRQCVPCGAVGNCPETSCDACDTPSIEWTMHMGGTSRSIYTLSDCKTLTLTVENRALPVRSPCTSAPPCVPARGEALSIAHLQNALADPAVEAALASGAQFGAITPGGFFTEFKVGDRAFTAHAACSDAQNCVDAPRGVDELRTIVERLADHVRSACPPSTP